MLEEAELIKAGQKKILLDRTSQDGEHLQLTSLGTSIWVSEIIGNSPEKTLLNLDHFDLFPLDDIAQTVLLAPLTLAAIVRHAVKNTPTAAVVREKAHIWAPYARYVDVLEKFAGASQEDCSHLLKTVQQNNNQSLEEADKNGHTPFLLAVKLGLKDAVDWFKAAGANIQAKDLDGHGSLTIALLNDRADIARDETRALIHDLSNTQRQYTAKQITDTLLARANNGDGTLTVALKNNSEAAALEFSKEIINSGLPNKVITDVLLNLNGEESALEAGLKYGNDEAVQKILQQLSESNLPQQIKNDVFFYERANGESLFSAALKHNCPKTVEFLMNRTFEREDLSIDEQVSFLSAETEVQYNGKPHRFPAFSLAMQRGHSQAAKKFREGIFNSNLPEVHQETLIAANDHIGVSALGYALKHQYDAEAVAHINDIDSSSLSDKSKRKLLFKPFSKSKYPRETAIAHHSPLSLALLNGNPLSSGVLANKIINSNSSKKKQAVYLDHFAKSTPILHQLTDGYSFQEDRETKKAKATKAYIEEIEKGGFNAKTERQLILPYHGRVQNLNVLQVAINGGKIAYMDTLVKAVMSNPKFSDRNRKKVFSGVLRHELLSFNPPEVFTQLVQSIINSGASEKLKKAILFDERVDGAGLLAMVNGNIETPGDKSLPNGWLGVQSRKLYADGIGLLIDKAKAYVHEIYAGSLSDQTKEHLIKSQKKYLGYAKTFGLFRHGWRNRQFYDEFSRTHDALSGLALVIKGIQKAEAQQLKQIRASDTSPGAEDRVRPRIQAVQTQTAAKIAKINELIETVYSTTENLKLPASERCEQLASAETVKRNLANGAIAHVINKSTNVWEIELRHQRDDADAHATFSVLKTEFASICTKASAKTPQDGVYEWKGQQFVRTEDLRRSSLQSQSPSVSRR